MCTAVADEQYFGHIPNPFEHVGLILQFDSSRTAKIPAGVQRL